MNGGWDVFQGVQVLWYPGFCRPLYNCFITQRYNSYIAHGDINIVTNAATVVINFLNIHTSFPIYPYFFRFRVLSLCIIIESSPI